MDGVVVWLEIDLFLIVIEEFWLYLVNWLMRLYGESNGWGLDFYIWWGDLVEFVFIIVIVSSE